jgi:hypothetical protein
LNGPPATPEVTMSVDGPTIKRDGSEFTFNTADIVVVPLSLVLFLRMIFSAYVPTGSDLALEFTVNLTQVGVVVTLPDEDDTVSQLGTRKTR